MGPDPLPRHDRRGEAVPVHAPEEADIVDTLDASDEAAP